MGSPGLLDGDEGLPEGLLGLQRVGRVRGGPEAAVPQARAPAPEDVPERLVDEDVRAAEDVGRGEGRRRVLV